MRLTRLAAIVSLLMLPFAAVAAGDDFYDHRIVMQVSDNDPNTMAKVLNVVTNVVKGYEDAGQTVTVRIVTFNAGLHLLREDTSPELERVKSFGASMPNVSFVACENTMAGMTKKEGKEPVLVANAERVPAGVIEIIRLEEDGWTVLRP